MYELLPGKYQLLLGKTPAVTGGNTNCYRKHQLLLWKHQALPGIFQSENTNCYRETPTVTGETPTAPGKPPNVTKNSEFYRGAPTVTGKHQLLPVNTIYYRETPTIIAKIKCYRENNNGHGGNTKPSPG